MILLCTYFVAIGQSLKQNLRINSLMSIVTGADSVRGAWLEARLLTYRVRTSMMKVLRMTAYNSSSTYRGLPMNRSKNAASNGQQMGSSVRTNE